MVEIFGNINEGIYLLNRKGDYIYCNNAFLKMVGATREEALRLPTDPGGTGVGERGRHGLCREEKGLRYVVL